MKQTTLATKSDKAWKVRLAFAFASEQRSAQRQQAPAATSSSSSRSVSSSCSISRSSNCSPSNNCGNLRTRTRNLAAPSAAVASQSVGAALAAVASQFINSTTFRQRLESRTRLRLSPGDWSSFPQQDAASQVFRAASTALASRFVDTALAAAALKVHQSYDPTAFRQSGPPSPSPKDNMTSPHCRIKQRSETAVAPLHRGRLGESAWRGVACNIRTLISHERASCSFVATARIDDALPVQTSNG